MSTASRLSAPAPAAAFQLERIRAEFPVLRQKVHGKPLVYLDSAATAQKPQAVIDAESRFYAEDYANVHRGLHQLSERATRLYEDARDLVRGFLNAADRREIVFTRGTTEAINLVAQSYGRRHVGAGDEVLLTGLEHHSNIVPWQMLCSERGAKLVVAPVDDRGEVPLAEIERRIGDRTRIVAIAHVSNALGTVLPVTAIAAAAHARGVPVLVDGAQAVPHQEVDVRALGADFYAFSAHKLYGPSGVGVLYGRRELLEAMPPWQGGGDMIRSVSFEKTTYNQLPYKFEAGTPNIAGVVGLGAAIAWLGGIGLAAVAAHEQEILGYAVERLATVPGLRFVGTAAERAGLVSFVLDGIHPHDLGTILDREGIAIRAGHHCAQPVMERFGLPATARASFGVYNGKDDVDALVRGLGKAREVLG